jgi:hypothetical protein
MERASRRQAEKRPNRVVWLGSAADEAIMDEELRRWVRPGDQVLAFTLRPGAGRWGGGSDLRRLTGRVSAATYDPRLWADAQQLEAGLARGLVCVPACNRRQRTDVLVPVLRAAQRLRAWTGRPDWLFVDDAAELLGDPDLPPDALNLGDGGHFLVLHGAEAVPPVLVETCEVTGGARARPAAVTP